MRNKNIITMAILTAFLLTASAGIARAGCCCCHDDVWVHIDLNFRDTWDWDDCCCCCYDYPWWEYPYWDWPPCWRRIVKIYYSPCGWYRYEYYDYPCRGCEYVYVEGRWVYRRAIRLRHRYTYRDMLDDFVRRRGLERVVYRTRTTTTTTTTVYRTSTDWHRTKSTSTTVRERHTMSSSVKSSSTRYRIKSTSDGLSSARYRSKSTSGSYHQSGSAYKRASYKSGSRYRHK